MRRSARVCWKGKAKFKGRRELVGGLMEEWGKVVRADIQRGKKEGLGSLEMATAVKSYG